MFDFKDWQLTNQIGRAGGGGGKPPGDRFGDVDIGNRMRPGMQGNPSVLSAGSKTQPMESQPVNNMIGGSKWGGF